MISPANISPGRFPPVHCSSQAPTLDLVQSHNVSPVTIPAEKLMVQTTSQLFWKPSPVPFYPRASANAFLSPD